MSGKRQDQCLQRDVHRLFRLPAACTAELDSIGRYWSFHAVLGGVDRAPARAGEPPMTWRDQLARDQMSDIRDFEAFGDHAVLKSYAYGDAGISPETTESPSVPAVEWAPPRSEGHKYEFQSLMRN